MTGKGYAAGQRLYRSRRGKTDSQASDVPTDLPTLDSPHDVGHAYYAARSGDRAAAEALRRRRMQLADRSITGWTDDGEPVRDDPGPEAA